MTTAEQVAMLLDQDRTAHDNEQSVTTDLPVTLSDDQIAAMDEMGGIQ